MKNIIRIINTLIILVMIAQCVTLKNELNKYKEFVGNLLMVGNLHQKINCKSGEEAYFDVTNASSTITESPFENYIAISAVCINKISKRDGGSLSLIINQFPAK